jgi:hypothetical protein
MARFESGGKLHAMRALAALCLSALVQLAACHGGTSAGGPREAPGAGGGGSSAGTAPARKKPGQVTFAPCETQPCMLHAGRGRYHRCLHAGGGRCFQYGPVCAPADQCMRDPASATYRTCTRVRSGECLEFGAACQPADRCMIDARDGLYRTCEAVSAGTCSRFGAVCAPKG